MDNLIEEVMKAFKEKYAYRTDLYSLFLSKAGVERYIFIYSDENRAETLLTLGRFASCPALSFTWYDVAILSSKIINIAEEK